MALPAGISFGRPPRDNAWVPWGMLGAVVAVGVLGVLLSRRRDRVAGRRPPDVASGAGEAFNGTLAVPRPHELEWL